MLARQKGKMTTSKDHKNLWPEGRSQRVTNFNTQADKRRLSHLSKNPMKEKNLGKLFNEKEIYLCTKPKLLTAIDRG
jgi:hypothetical protein